MSGATSNRAEATGSVVVHAELRRLFRESWRGQAAAAARAEAAPAAPELETVEAEPVAPEPYPAPTEVSVADLFSLGPPTPYRLRCDGRRPVSFDGFALVERSIETAIPDSYDPVCQHFGLYLSTQGTTVARIAMQVPEGLQARPLHKVAELGSNDELARMIGRYDPAEGLVWSASRDGSPAQEEHGAVAALRRDFDRLVKAALGAAVIRIHSETGSVT
ncbi:MAG: hypothetical protein AAGF76_01130 [Pseudomonadota bacterium]